MLEEGKNNVIDYPPFERKISTPLLNYEKVNNIALDSINKIIIQKKTTQGKINLDQNKVESFLYSTEESDKLTLHPNTRRDGFGTIIKKNQKNHRLRFKEKDFIDIVSVENWKKYNTFDMKDPSKGCECFCSLI